MGEIVFENGWISDFQGLVTLTLDRVILHTVMHHSSTSTYIPNSIEIEDTFCGRTDVRLRLTLLGRLGGVDLITKMVTNKFSEILHNGKCGEALQQPILLATNLHTNNYATFLNDVTLCNFAA